MPLNAHRNASNAERGDSATSAVSVVVTIKESGCRTLSPLVEKRGRASRSVHVQPQEDGFDLRLRYNYPLHLRLPDSHPPTCRYPTRIPFVPVLELNSLPFRYELHLRPIRIILFVFGYFSSAFLLYIF